MPFTSLERAYYVCGECQQWQIIHKQTVRAKRRNETPLRQTEASFVIVCQWLGEPPMLRDDELWAPERAKAQLCSAAIAATLRLQCLCLCALLPLLMVMMSLVPCGKKCTKKPVQIKRDSAKNKNRQNRRRE